MTDIEQAKAGWDAVIFDAGLDGAKTVDEIWEWLQGDTRETVSSRREFNPKTLIHLFGLSRAGEIIFEIQDAASDPEPNEHYLVAIVKQWDLGGSVEIRDDAQEMMRALILMDMAGILRGDEYDLLYEYGGQPLTRRHKYFKGIYGSLVTKPELALHMQGIEP